jgi:carbamoylphosphate synthase large subunit
MAISIMNRTQLRVGLTSTGGDMVASAMLSLRQNQEINLHIHAFNFEYSEVSASIADGFDVLPSGSDADYLPQIMELVKNNELQVLMPWSDEEALALSAAKSELAKAGCEVLVSPPNVMQNIADKSKTFDMVKAAGLRVPEYTVVSDMADINHAVKFYGYPERTVILKPAAGRGGRGVYVLLGDDSPPTWVGSGRREKRISSIDINEMELVSGGSYIVMPCLDAPVYDVDVFRFNNIVTKCFVRERDNPTGIPYTGNILRQNDEIREYAQYIASVMNLQSLHDIDMMTDPILGPVLLEINPRPSGSLAGLSSAGYRLLDYALACTAGIPINIDEVHNDTRIYTYTESLAFS